MAAESGPQGPDVEVEVETTAASQPRQTTQNDGLPYGARVEEELRREPWNFEFFQMVRLLEHLGTGKPVGRFDNPKEEAVRFQSNPALEFPPSQIHSLDWPENGQPRLTVNIMGLTGQLGVLPLPYTEWINDRGG